MKKILLIISLIFILITSGCIKRDNLEDITIYTTIYPVQYVTERLYGYNSEVLSIYPDGVNPKKYTLTKKQIKDYSKSAIFVYNGLSDEKNIARDFINNNKNIKIIDVSQGININNDVEELWLNPTDYLMLTQNIKNSLKEYISNKYIKEEIDKNYQKVKIDISEIDAELKRIAENAISNTIVISNNSLKFLEKYGFNIISLDEDTVDKSTVSKVKNLMNNGSINYIITLDNETTSDTVKNLISTGKVKEATIKTIATLTDEQRKNKDTYMTIMNENVELIKQECYS